MNARRWKRSLLIAAVGLLISKTPLFAQQTDPALTSAVLGQTAALKNINVQFRFNLADNTNLVIATGPYLACGVGGKTKFDGGASIGGIAVNGGDKVDTFGSDGLDYNRFDAGWNIGLGVEFGKILVGLDTQLGFCKVKDGNAPHNANIGITLGYKF